MKYEKTHIVTSINNGITETLSFLSLPGDYTERSAFNVYMIFVQDSYFNPSTRLEMHGGENTRECLDKEWFFGQAKRCTFCDHIYWKFIPILLIPQLSKYHFRIKSRPLFDISSDSPANNYSTSIDLIGETITPEHKSDMLVLQNNEKPGLGDLLYRREILKARRKVFFTQ